MTHRIISGIAFAAALTALSACQSSEDRAESHFQTALTHIENGDTARAKVEFQNVFKLNGQHRDARATFAKMQRDSGEPTAAYSQYLRLVEQYPDDIEGRKALAELALENANWDELRRHGEYLANLVPDDLTARVSLVALAYRDALISGDESARKAAFDNATALLAEDPHRQGLRQLMIDDYVRKRDWKRALSVVNDAIAVNESSLELQQTKLKLLYQINDPVQIERQFQDMMAAFPEDQRIVAALVQWHISRNELDEAEALLRARVDPESKSGEAGATLVRFLSEFRGPEVALEELNTLIARETTHQALFRSLRASINFDLGQRDEAIEEMRAVLETAEPSDETDTVKVSLAHMLEIQGNPVGARALVEEVLERDATHTEALKKRARWLIQDDQVGDAIATLRTALAGSPDDPDIMTLMANAHERDGNKELMSEMLALAVEKSGNAPDESLRYATHLMQQEKFLPAEDVLLAAVRIQPEDTQILTKLGELYIKMEDWSRNDGIVSALRRLDTEQANQLADNLTAQRLSAQKQDDELNAFLNSVATANDGATNADIVIIQRLLENGDTERALEHVEELMATAPGAPLFRFLRASILAEDNRVQEAEEVLTGLLDENDTWPEIWIALYRLQSSSGDLDKATKTLASARSALPDNAQLKWIEAGRLEIAGDIDGAIAIYEEMYATDSANHIIANNLASLLADHREDTESLERAYTIARRLRGSDVAPFQDTYGWIAYRLQNYDEAVQHLEPAAAGMGSNVTVQYHLAMAYGAVNRHDDALAQFKKVQAMLDPDNLPSFAQTLESEIARVTAAKAEAEN